jgi:hypothetical protein
MPVGAEAELALSRFVDTMCGNTQVQDDLNDVDDLEKLRVVVQSVESSLTGAALIPLEQATRPPKILVDSGVAAQAMPWRLLRCTGGPLVLQLICKKANNSQATATKRATPTIKPSELIKTRNFFDPLSRLLLKVC